MATERDYPTEDELKQIEAWPPPDWKALMQFVRNIWWMPDWGWTAKHTKKESTYNISTGGWSGNESLIRALQTNHMFWSLCWYSSRRGGHYVFKARPIGNME